MQNLQFNTQETLDKIIIEIENTASLNRLCFLSLEFKDSKEILEIILRNVNRFSGSELLESGLLNLLTFSRFEEISNLTCSIVKLCELQERTDPGKKWIKEFDVGPKYTKLKEKLFREIETKLKIERDILFQRTKTFGESEENGSSLDVNGFSIKLG